MRPSSWILVIVVLIVLAGCALAVAGRGTRQRSRSAVAGEESVSVNGKVRTFHLHVPPSYSPSRPVPLVFIFHGGGGNGKAIAGRLGFNELADRDGFIVVYPNGYEKNWNDGRGTTDAELAGMDDIAFVKVMIDDLTKRFTIDRRRIYATGVSNGGMFSNRIGCELYDQFAAIAFVAGPMPAPIARRCEPRQPISVLGIFGTDDPLIPWQGGQVQGGDRGPILGVEQTMDYWVSKNGCQKPGRSDQLPTQVNDGTKVTRTVYGGCRQGREVVFYRIDGGGHAWPGVQQRRERAGKSSHNLDASQVIWTFFSTQPPR